MTIHEVLSNSQNSNDASSGNRPVPSQRASSLHCQRTGETMLNRGVAGAMAQDQAYAAHTAGPRDPATKVYLLDMITNDMWLRPHALAGKQWFADFLCSCAVGALFGVKKTARNGADSTVGTWINTQVDALGMYATVAGAKKTFTVSGPAVAVCWIADNHTASQGVFEVRIDGLLVDTVRVYTGLDLSPYGTTYNGLRYGPATRLYETDEGVHVIEVKCISSGSNAYLSYVAGLGDQITFPKVFIGTGSKLNGVDDVISGQYRQIVLDFVERLAGLGLPVKAIDTWSALDPNLHFMPDGIHWNATGQVVVEQLMCDAEREPQTLTFPTVNGTTLSIQLNASGVAVSWTEI